MGDEENASWNQQLRSDMLWAVNLATVGKSHRSAYFSALHASLQPNADWLMQRSAEVILFRGSKHPPVVEEYLVSPIDKPTRFELVKVLPFYKRPLNSIEYAALTDMLTIACVDLDPLIQHTYEASLFTGTVSSSWPALSKEQLTRSAEFSTSSRCNEATSGTDHDNGNPSCLLPIFSSPLVTPDAPNRRRIWLRLVRQVAPFIQYPVDMQFQIDHTSLAVNEWAIIKIWFQDKYFSSVTELLSASQNSSFLSSIEEHPFFDLYPNQLKPTPHQLDTKRSHSSRAHKSSTPDSRQRNFDLRGNVRSRSENDDSNFGTQSSADSGHQSYSRHDRSSRRIYIDHRRVIYQNWDFHLTVRRDTGLRLYGIYFANLSYIAEAGLDETVTAYWGFSPFLRTMTSLESMFGVGAMIGELKPGIDCPVDAIYLPVQLVPSGDTGPQLITKGICLFEWLVDAPGGPGRRHFEFLPGDASHARGKHTDFAFGTEGKGLVVRMISSLFNYDYLFDVVLSSSGNIEFAVTPTGYIHVDTFRMNRKPGDSIIPGPFWMNTIHPFGFPSTKFPITFAAHHHLFHFKVDIDLLGRKNFFQIVDIMGASDSPEGVKLEQGPGRLDTTVWPALWMQVRKVERELDARISKRFEHPKQFLVCSKNSSPTSSTDSPRRNPHCLTIDNHSPIKTLFSDEHMRSFAWARHQMSITRQHDHEPYASSIFNGVDLNEPLVDFTQFSADNESISDEDIVLWLTVGNYHMPRQEDLPNTPTNGGRLYFVLRPHNIFAYSPDAFNCDRFYTNSLDEWLEPLDPDITSCRPEPIPVL